MASSNCMKQQGGCMSLLSGLFPVCPRLWRQGGKGGEDDALAAGGGVGE